MKVPGLARTSRRDLLRGLAALGATTLLPSGNSPAQAPAGAARLVPPSQIVFGTDFPFANAPVTVTGVDSSGFSADELRGIYRNNAAKFLPRYA